jgi:hypothetical protein
MRVYHLASTVVESLWTIGILACLAVGVQAVGDRQPPTQVAQPANEPSADETARLIEENRRLNRRLVDAATQAQEAKDVMRPATPMTFGPNGTVITLDEYWALHPEASPRYRSNKPRPKWQYRPPTCTPSRAQLAWAKMLPNHDGLAMRGLSDEEIVAHLAPSEVKALEGEEVPEHLRPDTRPAVVFVNGRCKDGTCTTGYCEASRRNIQCKDGRCPVPRR